jgi:hypothetical protein
MTKEDLSRLNEVIRDFLGSGADVTFQLRCSDAVRTYGKITPALEYENPPKKALRSLHITAYSEDRRKRVWIRLVADRDPSRSISIDVSGDDVLETSIQNCVTKLGSVLI